MFSGEAGAGCTWTTMVCVESATACAFRSRTYHQPIFWPARLAAQNVTMMPTTATA